MEDLTMFLIFVTHCENMTKISSDELWAVLYQP